MQVYRSIDVNIFIYAMRVQAIRITALDCSNKVLLKSEHFFDLGRLRCHSFANRPPRMIKDVSLARGMISCAGTGCGRRVPRSNQFPKISSEMNSEGLEAIEFEGVFLCLSYGAILITFPHTPFGNHQKYLNLSLFSRAPCVFGLIAGHIFNTV